MVVLGALVRGAAFPEEPPLRTVGVRRDEVPELRLALPLLRTVGVDREAPPLLRAVGVDRVAPPLLLTVPEVRLDPPLLLTVPEPRAGVPPPLLGLVTLDEGREAGFLVGCLAPEEVAEEPGRVGRRSRTGLPEVPELPAAPGLERAVEGTVVPDAEDPDRRVAVPSTPGLDCPVTPGGLPPAVPGLNDEGDPERGTALRCWVPSTPGRLTGGVVLTTT